LDLTIRVQEDAQVDVQPDNTVELSWPLPGGSRATVLIKADAAKRLNERLTGLLMLIPANS
jgi:hypothetical protein